MSARSSGNSQPRSRTPTTAIPTPRCNSVLEGDTPMTEKLNLLSSDAKTRDQAAPDTFDPEQLRIDLNFSEGVGVKKAIITIPVKKPSGQDFIRVHPSAAFRLPVAIIELRDDRETFLVLPDIARDIPGE